MHSFHFVHADLLSITDAREIIRLTWDYRAKWKLIGIQLSIDAGTLDAIEANHRNVEECLSDMINKWLRNDKPRPTRGAISAALQSGCVLGITGMNVAIYHHSNNERYELEHIHKIYVHPLFLEAELRNFHGCYY